MYLHTMIGTDLGSEATDTERWLMRVLSERLKGKWSENLNCKAGQSERAALAECECPDGQVAHGA